MSRLEKLRAYFDNWQAQGYETRPVWMDRHIEASINQLTNVELLELLDMFDESEEQEKQMIKNNFEMGAVCLGSAGFVASWQRSPVETNTAYRRQPLINIFETASVDENGFVPATSITIYGREALLALRAAIDAALLNEPNEESK